MASTFRRACRQQHPGGCWRQSKVPVEVFKQAHQGLHWLSSVPAVYWRYHIGDLVHAALAAVPGLLVTTNWYPADDY
jgi:hypothetical protein